MEMNDFVDLPLMKKKMSNVFPTYVLGYDNPNFHIHNQQIKECLENLEFSPGPHQPFQTIDNHLEKQETLKSFFTWIDICLEDYRRTFKYNCDSFKVILSWANKSNNKGSHRAHVHPNAYLSGIYYVSDDLSPTYFEDPRYQARSGFMVGSYSHANSVVWECPAETGTLVLFPSWLSHYTEAAEYLNDWRITLSFNIIPAGNVNKGTLLEFTYE